MKRRSGTNIFELSYESFSIFVLIVTMVCTQNVHKFHCLEANLLKLLSDTFSVFIHLMFAHAVDEIEVFLKNILGLNQTLCELLTKED